MKTPEWLKPALGGAVAGAVAISIVGFSWGGWVTGSGAEAMANDHAKAVLSDRLVSICVAQANNNPEFKEKFAEIKEIKSYQQREAVMDSGWATMPDEEDPDRSVAKACLNALEKANAGA